MAQTIPSIPIAVEANRTPCMCSIVGEAVFFRPYARDTDPVPDLRTSDGWLLRDAFMNIKTTAEVAQFLEQYGIFDEHHPGGNIKLKQVKRWQDAIRWLLSNVPVTWGWFAIAGMKGPVFKEKSGGTRIDYGALLHQFDRQIYAAVVRRTRFSVTFRWMTRIGAKGKPAERHTACIVTTDVLTAILATVYIEHQRNAKYATCARHDCLKPYEITSNRKRLYCSQQCAHLESVRRNRAKQKATG